MNLEETRTFLTQLWCAFPSAPRMSEEDKKAMVIVWFTILKDYSFRDVWFAAEKAISKNCKFIPSAYEIRGECREYPDVDMYLTNEYRALEKAKTGYTHYYSDNPFLENRYLICELEHTDNKKRIQEINEALERNNKESEREDKLRSMYREAEKLALKAYHQKESDRYTNDVLKLGLQTTRMEAIA